MNVDYKWSYCWLSNWFVIGVAKLLMVLRIANFFWIFFVYEFTGLWVYGFMGLRVEGLDALVGLEVIERSREHRIRIQRFKIPNLKLCGLFRLLVFVVICVGAPPQVACLLPGRGLGG